MTSRFAHPDFDRFDFSEIPVNRDVCLMDECWIDDYEKALISLFEGGNYEEIGYIAPVTWTAQPFVDTRRP